MGDIADATATPQRRDGHQPIIEMQLGLVRFAASRRHVDNEPRLHRSVIIRDTTFRHPEDNPPSTIQAWYAALASDERRNALLDTLFLALPISWKGTLEQYAGRLHRQHVGKAEVQIVNYVDRSVPMLRRVSERRLKSYRAMGYVVGDVSKRAQQRTLRIEDEESQRAGPREPSR